MDATPQGNHAFLILAHQDEIMLRRIVKRMSSLGPIFVHIDAKTDFSTWHCSDLPCTFLGNRVEVFWGHWSVVEATVRLLEAALVDPTNSRFTLLSGTHYPIISNATLALKAQLAGDVIGSRPAPNMPDGSRPESDYQRRFYKTLQPNSDWSRIKNAFFNRIVYFGRPLDWRSVTPESGMRAGEQFWSITRDFAEYCVATIRSSSPLIEYFQRIVCSDEKVFATLYGDYAREISLEGTTFTKWMKRPHQNGEFPAPLSRRDLEEAIKLDKFWFARKLSTSDQALLDWLDEL